MTEVLAARLVAVLGLLAGAPACTALFPFEAPDPTGDRCVAGRFSGRIDDVAVDGDYAFAASIDEVLVLDVSVPAAVREVDSFGLFEGAEAVGAATTIAADGAVVVVGTDQGEAIVLRAEDPEDLTRGGLIGPLGGEMTDVVVADPFAFATRRQQEGSAIHGIDLESVALGGRLDLDGQAFGLSLSEQVVAVALGAAGILLLQDATLQTSGTEIDTGGSAKQVAAVEAGWLVAASTALLAIREPDWTEVTLLDRSRQDLGAADFQDVVVAGELAVVAAGAAGAAVLGSKTLRSDVPFEVVPSASPALHVAIDGDRAYVACGNEGLVILDLPCLEQ